jgi:O-antigen/teichoic acid export membrane protein
VTIGGSSVSFFREGSLSAVSARRCALENNGVAELRRSGADAVETHGRGSSTGRGGPRIFIKNSLANLASGLSTAVLSLLVPPVLSRYLSQAEFSAWMLILQLATYTALLNLGLQGATSRYVAHYLARNDRDSASDIVSTAFFTLVLTAMVAAALILVAGENLGRLFPALPASLAGAGKSGLLLMGFALALGMPVEAIAGTFTGIQRNELVAFIQGGSRLVLAVALITIVVVRGGVTSMAAAFAIVNVAGYFAFWWTSRRLDIVHISYRRAHWQSFRQIWAYCGTLLVWTVAMFFINGFDVAIVGRVDFSAVGVYSVCFGPILLIAGVQQALFSPLLQFGAAQSSQSSERSLPPLLLRSTRLSTLLLLSLSVPLLLFSRDLLGWWLGPKYADQALTIFRLLLIGNTTRLLATPYAMLLLATLKHKRVLLPPIVEAMSNVLVAITAGLRFGAVGVACGVVAGALIGQLMIVYINAPRTMEVIGNLRTLLWKGVIQPVACYLPGLVVAVTAVDRLSAPTRSLIDASALIACAGLAWSFSLGTDEKALIRSALSKVTHSTARQS